jgi:serine/threonine protein kinase
MSFCPRCRVGQVDEGATECPICGYELPKDKTVAMRVADELEQTVRKELGRYYQVERPLGQGGMSVVYLARELDLNRSVAVKVLPVRLSFDQESVKRFQREAKIAAGLDHPHIVPVYRVGTTPSLLWYAMKLVEGQSLAQILKAHPQMGADEVVAIIEQVGAALHYAHRRGVVHRDVKPSNVMVDQDGWAWVCDFGVAKAFGAVPLTQTGSTLGTPRYMSPEQCYGGALDGRSDQYSLATLTYECLAGQPAFIADSIGEYVHKHTSVPVPSLRETRPDLPDNIVDAVARALSKAPDKRFPDVRAFVDALGGETERRTLNFVVAASEPRGPVTPVTLTPSIGPHSTARWRRPARLGVAAVVLLGGLAAVAPWLLRHGAPSATQAVALSPDSQPVTSRTGTGSAGAALAPAPTRDSTHVTARPTRSRARPNSAAGQQRRVATTPPAASAPAPQRPAPAVTPAILRLTTTPVLGDLYVDGKRTGSSFQTGLPLTPGHHEIRITRDGYEPFVRAFDVVAGDTVKLLQVPLQPVHP